MMHGYLAFDDAGELLVPFRTWRNTNTSNAAQKLSTAFDCNIPHRWSVAHLYQALLDNESHVSRIAYLTTLAGYVHWQLSGEKILGVGDASGMFPIDVTAGGYDRAMLATFDALATPCGLPSPLIDLLPGIRNAGQPAGRLTKTGARLLDPTGALTAGAPLCPPEGDAGTGMVATNSVAPGTGNISAGTSIFAMVVLRDKLRQTHPELDLVTTPSGDLVAMVHCNNGASELDAWASVFTEVTAALGLAVDKSTVFDTLVRSSLDGEPDCGGLVAFNYLSGEPITGLHEGRPLILRTPDSRLTLANFMRSQLYTALVTLRIGMDILQKTEQVHVDRMFAHGGLFTTKGVAQRFLAAAINTPVCVGDTATEGGAWGISILAAFLLHQSHGQTLPEFLQHAVFTAAKLESVNPTPARCYSSHCLLSRPQGLTRAFRMSHLSLTGRGGTCPTSPSSPASVCGGPDSAIAVSSARSAAVRRSHTAGAVTGAKADERQVLLDLLDDAALTRQIAGTTLIADKNYYGRDFQTTLAATGL